MPTKNKKNNNGKSMSSSISREEIDLASKEEEGQNGVSQKIADKKRKHAGSSSGETQEEKSQRRLEFSEEYEGETVMDITGGNSGNMAGIERKIDRLADGLSNVKGLMDKFEDMIHVDVVSAAGGFSLGITGIMIEYI